MVFNKYDSNACLTLRVTVRTGRNASGGRGPLSQDRRYPPILVTRIKEFPILGSSGEEMASNDCRIATLQTCRCTLDQVMLTAQPPRGGHGSRTSWPLSVLLPCSSQGVQCTPAVVGTTCCGLARHDHVHQLTPGRAYAQSARWIIDCGRLNDSCSACMRRRAMF